MSISITTRSRNPFSSSRDVPAHVADSLGSIPTPPYGEGIELPFQKIARKLREEREARTARVLGAADLAWDGEEVREYGF